MNHYLPQPRVQISRNLEVGVELVFKPRHPGRNPDGILSAMAKAFPEKHFLNIYLFIYLKDRVTEREAEREMFHVLVHSLIV